jgi:hypothetical protein
MCFQDSEVELERSFTYRSFAFTGTRAGFEVSSRYSPLLGDKAFANSQAYTVCCCYSQLRSLKMQKSFIAIALALTLTSAFAGYTAQNYVRNLTVVAADNDTSYISSQTNLTLVSVTPGNVYLYAASFTPVTNNITLNNWSLFYRQLNIKTLAAAQNYTATIIAPVIIYFLNNYAFGFAVDNATGLPNVYAYQLPLTSGTTGPTRLQLSNNTNPSFTPQYVAYAQIANTIYVAYYGASNSTNITSFTVGATAPETPFTLSTTFDTPYSLSLTWGEALGSNQLFALWIEYGVLKDAVVDVSKKTVATPTVIPTPTPVPGYNTSTSVSCSPFVTDKTLYGELCRATNFTLGTTFYWVRTNSNSTLTPIINYPSNTSTFYTLAPYGPYLAVFFQSTGAANGTNYAYELWDLNAFTTTSVQPRKLYLTIDATSTQTTFRVISGGYYTLLYNNAPTWPNGTINGTITNIQVGLLLGSSYLASVLGFLLTIVAGLLLF